MERQPGLGQRVGLQTVLQQVGALRVREGRDAPVRLQMLEERQGLERGERREERGKRKEEREREIGRAHV